MSNPKSHHFVPQFYLRNFSADRRTVACYLLGKGQIEPKVFVRSQCAEEHFYGSEPTVEKALSELEGHAAKCIQAAMASNEKPDPKAHLTLLFFAAFQLKRTPVAAGQAYDLVNEVFQALAKSHPDPSVRDSAEEMIVHTDHPALEALGGIDYLLAFLFDLNCRLLVNSTSLEFVTSDNPAVAYNILDPGRSGLGRPGTMLYLPLSPKRAVLWYDAENLKIDKRTDAFALTDEHDVRALNQLIAINAEERLFACSTQFPMLWSPGRNSHGQVSHEVVGESKQQLVVVRRGAELPVLFSSDSCASSAMRVESGAHGKILAIRQCLGLLITSKDWSRLVRQSLESL